MTIEDVLDHVAVRHPETSLAIAQSIASAAQTVYDEVASPNPEVAQAQADVITAQSLVTKYTTPTESPVEETPPVEEPPLV